MKPSDDRARHLYRIGQLVDLRLPDGDITKILMTEIHQARHAITEKRHNASHLPWDALELMDHKHFNVDPIRNFDSSERSKVSRDAQAQYNTACKEAGIEP